MAKSSDTRQRIQSVARELFAEKGVQRTSLQDIAARLGITKAALYYHFANREELVRSIIQPFIDDGETFIRRYESAGRFDERVLLEEYFDLHHAHRDDLVFVLTELTTLADLGMVETVLGWRTRLTTLLVGTDASLPEAAAATVALGGLQDCTIQFSESPRGELRAAAVDAACAALGLR